MSYNLTIKEQGNILHVTAEGKRPRRNHFKEKVKDMWDSVLEICNEKKINRVLIASKTNGDIPLLGLYEMTSSWMQYGVKYSWKIAIVSLLPEYQEDLKFTETVAINNGGPIRFFDNENKAFEWLQN